MDKPFEYHRPGDEEIARIEAIRLAYQALFEVLVKNTRPGIVSGRYVGQARMALEESAMWATKSIVFERENP